MKKFAWVLLVFFVLAMLAVIDELYFGFLPGEARLTLYFLGGLSVLIAAILQDVRETSMMRKLRDESKRLKAENQQLEAELATLKQAKQPRGGISKVVM